MAIDFPRELRDVFDVRNDVRAREVIEALQAIVRGTPQGASTPVTGPLTPAAKQLAIVTEVTTSRIMGAEDVVLVDDDTAGGDVTITLPPAADPGYPRFIKKLGTTGNVIIDGNGAETIDGGLTATLTEQYECLMLIPDVSNWQIL